LNKNDLLGLQRVISKDKMDSVEEHDKGKMVLEKLRLVLKNKFVHRNSIVAHND
jgi:hypothetical protein